MDLVSKMATGGAEANFAKKLAHNEKKTRDLAVKKLRAWIRSRPKDGPGIYWLCITLITRNLLLWTLFKIIKVWLLQSYACIASRQYHTTKAVVSPAIVVDETSCLKTVLRYHYHFWNLSWHLVPRLAKIRSYFSNFKNIMGTLTYNSNKFISLLND